MYILQIYDEIALASGGLKLIAKSEYYYRTHDHIITSTNMNRRYRFPLCKSLDFWHLHS